MKALMNEDQTRVERQGKHKTSRTTFYLTAAEWLRLHLPCSGDRGHATIHPLPLKVG